MILSNSVLFNANKQFKYKLQNFNECLKYFIKMAWHSRYSRANKPIFSMLILSCLLMVLINGAIAPTANQMIEEAIKAAIEDGLKLIDADLRTTYWYYLKGAQITSYSTNILADRVNYIIIYDNLGNNFKVNCDLIKRTFLPSLNSFVKTGVTVPGDNQAKNNQTSLDLTNLQNFNKTVLVRAAANTIISPPIVVIDSKNGSLSTGYP